MMILDFTLVHYVWNHAPVSYNMLVLMYGYCIWYNLKSGNQFEEGTFCVSECQDGFQPMNHICEPCPNGVCVGGRSE